MFITSFRLNLEHTGVDTALSVFTLQLEVCGYTRTRGFTRTRPVPAGWVRVG